MPEDIAASLNRMEDINRASLDPDLVASMELRALGYTDTVNPDRADVLDAYNPFQLRDEVCETYDIGVDEYRLAVCMVYDRIARRRADGKA